MNINNKRFMMCKKKDERMLCKIIFKIITCYLITLGVCFAHEPWLLTPHEMTSMENKPGPAIFMQLNFDNSLLIFFTFMFVIVWLYFCYKRETLKKQHPLLWQYQPSKPLQQLAIIVMRLLTGAMLIICAFGLIPREGTAPYTVPTLLTPDMQLTTVVYGYWIKWIEVIVAILLILGVFIRIGALMLGGLALLSCYLFGSVALQYLGYYLGIACFLFLVYPPQPYKMLFVRKQEVSYVKPLLILQVLTGLSFLYAAITCKWMHPNVDMLILEKNHAFTFGFGYDYFTFLMFLVEAASGIILIAGYGLRIFALILFGLFLFLSFDVNENIFAHSFIFAILFVFLMFGGVPLFHLKK